MLENRLLFLENQSAIVDFITNNNLSSYQDKCYISKEKINDNLLLKFNENNFFEFNYNKNEKTKNLLLVIICSDKDELNLTLIRFIDYENIHIVAVKTAYFYLNNPLFLISIPKSGTHLLFKLVNLLGYKEGSYINGEKNLPGYWYPIQYSSTHTYTKRFVEHVRTEAFGYRYHNFAYSPCLMIYRNPISILFSEARYYPEKGKTVYYNYFKNLTFKEILINLLDHPFLGTIRDRINNYTPWIEFPNVLPISFEELIGEKGSGDDAERDKVIWSLLLKLNINGNVAMISDQLFDKESPTFREGKIKKDKLDIDLKEKFLSLDQDFMKRLGFKINKNGSYNTSSLRRKEFMNKIISYDNKLIEEPFLLERSIFFDIVCYSNYYYAIPYLLKDIDLASIELRRFNNILSLKKIYRSGSLVDLKRKIFIKNFIYGLIHIFKK